MAKRTTSDFKYAFGNNSEAVKNYMTSKSIMAEFKKEIERGSEEYKKLQENKRIKYNSSVRR